MGFRQFARGTSGLMKRVRELCNFARRYPYEALLLERTSDSAMGDAITALIAACDAFQILDNNPWESDAISPSTSPEDTEEGGGE